MIFRIAKLSDLKQIVNLHYKVRDTYSVGYFSQMGKMFIKEYYKIVLNDPYEVFVCAEDENGIIRGFCSATLDVKKQFERMRKYKFKFALMAIPSLICKPSLIKSTIERYRATKGNHDEKYIPKEGARIEYWTWDAECKDSESSVDLFNNLLLILYELGVNILHGEVDAVNKKVLKFHRINQAQILEKVTLSDGRERFLIDYNLSKRFQTK